MFVCSVILYDPNVRDYIHTYTSKTRFRLERFRCRSTSREARGDDDAIDRTIDSSMVERSRMDDDDDVLVASSSSSCFERLGLGDATTRTTTREHVRRAFRRLVIDAHPDRRNGCSRAYHALVRDRDEAYEAIDRRDLLAGASTYDWRATRTKMGREEREGRGEETRRRARERGTGTKADEGANDRGGAKETSSLANDVVARFDHRTRVTAMTAAGDVVVVGETNGRVSCWRVDDGALVGSCASSSSTDANDAVSIVRLTDDGRLAATYVTSKPRFWTVNARAMSAPRETTDAHGGRITAANWFEPASSKASAFASDGGIREVFVTAALDGSVFVRARDGSSSATRAPTGDAFGAVKALEALATDAREGTFVVSDVAGRFQLWTVRRDRFDDDALAIEPRTNIVHWSGFGGVSAASLAVADAGASFRLLTVFVDASVRQSRVLEWKIPILDTGVFDVRGFVGAVPNANETIRGAVADFLPVVAASRDDDDDDDDESSEELYLIAVDDAVLAVDASSRRVLYTIDRDACRALSFSSSAGVLRACRVASDRRAVALDARAADDGALVRAHRSSIDDIFLFDTQTSSIARPPPVLVAFARASPALLLLAHRHRVVAIACEC